MFDPLVNWTQGPRSDATKTTRMFFIHIFHSSDDTCLPGAYSNTTVSTLVPRITCSERTTNDS